MPEVDRAPSTLAKYAVIGGGPVFQLMGRDPVYVAAGVSYLGRLSKVLTSSRSMYVARKPVFKFLSPVHMSR
jgi:hypothetical protein